MTDERLARPSASNARRKAVNRRSVAVLLGSLMVAVGLVSVGWSRAGVWLLVDDDLQHAAAIVPLGGEAPLRSIEAARIYRQGWAPEIWITRGDITYEDEALAGLGIDRPQEPFYVHQVLTRMGVPEAAIRLLDGTNVNTADEIRTIANAARAAGAGRIIVVTSKFHSRRVRALWRKLVGPAPDVTVRYTPDDPSDPARWWATTADMRLVAREWFGLANAVLGFPVPSSR
jgi:uncharacterized SAM-binding protein YcdF (DUF218 family)